MAGLICKEAKKKLWVRDRGVKSAGFYVLKGARMPSVLAEVGFLSNRSEEKRLRDAAYRDMVAEAIARGILKYKDEYEYTQAFTK